MSDRILITGGAGFIGSYLSGKLLEDNYKVTVIDDLSTGSWDNIVEYKNNPNFRVIISSIMSPGLFELEVQKHDFVFHLASAVGVKLIMNEPVKSIENIFTSTGTVLKYCSKYRIPVLITSSSEVYGKSETIPFAEDDDVVMGATSKRRWSYASAKALDEFLALAHYLETKLDVYVVRLFNTVGPRQTGQYGMVMPTFVNQALKNQPITVYGDGSQKRCFCSVFDVIAGLSRFMNNEEAVGKVINLGSNEEISISELADRVISLTNSKSEIQFIPYDDAYGKGFDDIKRRMPDVSRAKKYLNWESKYTLDDIIKSIAEYISKTNKS